MKIKLFLFSAKKLNTSLLSFYSWVNEMKLEELSSLSKDAAAQLRSMGITSVESLVTRSLSEMKEWIENKWINISYEKAKEIMEEAWRKTGFWFTPGDQIEAIRGKRAVFTSGSKTVDEMLGGGIFSGEITEFVGDFASGKTEFLLTIMVEALGANKDMTAIFIDTENTFTRERVEEISKGRGYDSNDILKRIIYIPVMDSDFLSEIIDRLHLTIESRNVKIILIDSIMAILRADYIGREVLWYRQQMLNRMLRRLLNLAKVYNITVVISNQVVTNPQAQFTYDPIQQKVPTGGTILGHNANTRLYLRRAQGNKRIVRLFDSSWRPEAECVVQITSKGIVDAEGD
jgi:DNA repair protein RadA